MVGIGDTTATIKMPVSLSAVIIVLGNNSPSIKIRYGYSLKTIINMVLPYFG